jgi:hypothetical protein
MSQLYVIHYQYKKAGMTFLNGKIDKSAPMHSITFKLKSSQECSHLIVVSDGFVNLMAGIINELKDIPSWAMPLETFKRNYSYRKEMKLFLLKTDPAAMFDIYRYAFNYLLRKENNWDVHTVELYRLKGFDLVEVFDIMTEKVIETKPEDMIPFEQYNTQEKDKNMEQQNNKSGFDFKEMIKLQIANMLMKNKGKIPLSKLTVLQSFAETGHIDIKEVIKANYQEEMLKRIENSNGNLDLEEMMYLQMVEEGDFSAQRIFEARMAASMMKGFGCDEEEAEEEKPAKTTTAKKK